MPRFQTATPTVAIFDRRLHFELDHSRNFLGLPGDTLIYDTLTDFAQAVEERGARLVVSFNPIGWQCLPKHQENLKSIYEQIERVQREFPKLWVINNPLTVWEPVKFGMFNHVAREYVHVNSTRLGRTLAKLIKTPSEYQPFNAERAFALASHPRKVEVTETGMTASPEQKRAAMAYFLYTATSDDKYKKWLSQRTLSELAKDKSFAFMMWDNRTRLEALSWEGVTFDYDLSQLNASLVNVVNGQRCVTDPSVVWIKLSGFMRFVINIKQERICEPVEWPSSHQIFMPVVFEDGEWKFDGYCPEDTGDASINFRINPVMLGFDQIAMDSSTSNSPANSGDRRSDCPECGTVVNQLLWYRMMGANPSRIKRPYGRVDNVKPAEVSEFVSRLNNTVGRSVFHLPAGTGFAKNRLVASEEGTLIKVNELVDPWKLGAASESSDCVPDSISGDRLDKVVVCYEGRRLRKKRVGKTMTRDQ